MILTLAALLLQFPATPQSWDWKPSANPVETSSAVTPDTTAKGVASHGPDPAVSTGVPAESTSASSLILNSPIPVKELRPAALPLSPRIPSQDRSAESRRRKWLALMIAQHGAATFDAWSTRQAISTGQYRELNPALRPFAENASLYAAIQVGPLVFDYLGMRMMTSQHGWLRHTWWIPQALSTAISLGSGAHNLGAR
jgi:hypothetical protein